MLGVTLQINEKILAFYEIRRVFPVDRQPANSTMCQYRVFDEEGNQLLDKPVYHRYGQGAERLAFKVLGKLNRGKRK
jgi:hypothetical protein